MRRSVDIARFRNAFTLIELLLVIAIIALLIGILLPALAEARRSARVAVCSAGMQQLGRAQGVYSAEGKQSLAGFSWEVHYRLVNGNVQLFTPPGDTSQQKTKSQFADLNTTDGQVQTHANQAVDIVRRQLGRTAAEQGRIENRNLARNFWTLVYVDGGYLSDRLPEPAVLCPEDARPQKWARNWNKSAAEIIRETGNPDPGATPQAAYQRMLPFWTSYQMVPAAFTPDFAPNPVYQDLSLPEPLLYWTPPNTLFTARRADEVLFPAQKVATFDPWDRHFHNRRVDPIWYAYPSSKQPLLFFDGSVRPKLTREANKGWDPRPGLRDNPNITTRYRYIQVAPSDPRPLYTPAASALNTVDGYYRWTRMGLQGVDFSGQEVRSR